mgnify:FL=1
MKHIQYREYVHSLGNRDNQKLLGVTEVEINPTELCNRACSFCPRYDPEIYPNRNLNMSVKTASVLSEQLFNAGYNGIISICGFGEPLLNPKIKKIIKQFSPFHTELITNGDRILNGRILIKDLGVDSIMIDCYDGEEQVKKTKEIVKDCGIPYRIRDKYDDGTGDYKKYLHNNRGGILGQQEIARPCYITTYKMVVDWNGDILLCENDWSRKQKTFGNIHQRDVSDIWNDKSFLDVRKKLIEGKRQELESCANCNVNGILMGEQSVDLWKERFGLESAERVNSVY